MKKLFLFLALATVSVPLAGCVVVPAHPYAHPNAVWVPGHWGPYGWVRGHWA
jgi:hypothetical protein